MNEVNFMTLFYSYNTNLWMLCIIAYKNTMSNEHKCCRLIRGPKLERYAEKMREILPQIDWLLLLIFGLCFMPHPRYVATVESSLLWGGTSNVMNVYILIQSVNLI